VTCLSIITGLSGLYFNKGETHVIRRPVTDRSLVTRLRAERRTKQEFDSRLKKMFSSSQRLNRLWSPSSPKVQAYSGAPSPGIKLPKCAADHTPFGAEVKNRKSYTSTLHTPSWRGGVYLSSFTCHSEEGRNKMKQWVIQKTLNKHSLFLPSFVWHTSAVYIYTTVHTKLPLISWVFIFLSFYNDVTIHKLKKTSSLYSSSLITINSLMNANWSTKISHFTQTIRTLSRLLSYSSYTVSYKQHEVRQWISSTVLLRAHPRWVNGISKSWSSDLICLKIMFDLQAFGHSLLFLITTFKLMLIRYLFLINSNVLTL
jgi:hypothetical protein